MTDAVIELVERSNQRGGRMLSVIDLVAAGTLTQAAACRLLGRILAGSSWLVGARPGGAGKTTVMSALLAMLPPDEKVRLTVAGTGWEKSAPGDCVVCYEISPGHYDGYLWGNQVAVLARLAASGCRVVANLHADTVAEAERQVVGDNNAAPEDFAAFAMFLPVRVAGGLVARRRRVGPISGFADGAWHPWDADAPLTAAEQKIGLFLDQCRDRECLAVAAVRQAWCDWLATPKGENAR